MKRISDDDLEAAVCVCGEPGATPRRVQSRDEMTGRPFTYVQCAACGTDRVSPRPRPADIGGYYSDSYASHVVRPDSRAQQVKHLIYRAFYAPQNDLGPWRPLLQLLLYPLRGHCVMPFKPIQPRRVFEFGAATGNDLALFRAEGWAVDGCEPSARACQIAAQRGITIQNCPAEQAQLPPGGYSAVVLNNVLEHLHDPAAVLAKCAQGLMSGGSLILILPNHASWSARLFGGSWPGYDAPRHLWGFTPESLSAAVQRSGLVVDRVHHLFPGRWVWRSSLDGRHLATPVARWRIRHAAALSLALLPFGWLAAAVGRGDFMTLVARKP